MNGLEIYNDILANTHNLKGTWEVTAENYLNVTGNTNGSIVLFDQTVGALGDFILEWTAEQKGGSYIHSNLCPSLRYTPEDAGTEGGGDNYAMLVYLCNYGGNPGTFNLRTENGTKSTVNTSGVSLNIDTVYTFKFERLKDKYRLYQDGVLINEASDITDKKLYLGWYLWYGGTNSDYQTNFILREYNLTKINTYHYLDTIGLTSLWAKIKSLFATKTELASKANDSDVVHHIGNETIDGVKTFSSQIVGSIDKAEKDLNGNIITETYATKSENNTKADKSTTLSGYGITDAYTKTQVDTKVADLVNSAPETLDTLNELASALGNDPNFATTVANQIGTKANDSDVVHKSGNETIAGDKGFFGTVYSIGTNGLWFRYLDGSTSENLDGDLYLNYHNYSRPVHIGNQGYVIYNNGANYSGTAQKAIQDSNGNQISSTYLPLAGGKMTGGDVYKSTDDGYLAFGGATKYANGATVVLYGKDNSATGNFELRATDGTSSYGLKGTPTGSLTWGGMQVERYEGAGDGYIRYASGLQICWGETNTTSNTGTWTYPKPFKSIPCVLWQALGNDTSLFDVVGGGNRTTSNAVFIPFRGGADSFAPYGVACFAIGFWK